MTKELTIEAETRTELGKNAARRLRSAGKIPAVLYGGKGPAQPLIVDPRAVEKILHSEAGENTLFGLKIGSQGVLPGKVMIKQHRLDPVTDKLTHADFMRIQMDKAIRVQVVVNTIGIAKGVKLQGGIVDHPLREVEVECLPADIPERIDIDITELEINRSYRVSDLKAPQGVKILTDPHAAVVAVLAPAIEEVAAPAAAEGAAVAEAPAEPELIKKGKGEGEEAAEAPKKEEKKGAAKPEKK